MGTAPEVGGPVTGGSGPNIVMTAFDLEPLGYRRDEYFVEGEAVGYEVVGELHEDGRWTVRPGPTAGYRTRIITVRPIDPDRFDGTVVVEWFNVSAGLDSAPDWTFTHTELLRRGSAYVGVSAQRVGVEGGRSIAGLPASGLKAADPERYATLDHPGDTFSFDIFSAVGRLLRDPRRSPLGELVPATVVAMGESQSAFCLVTYANAVDPLAAVYDGFLIHGRGGSSAPISRAPQTLTQMPGRVHLRSDLRAPVLVVESETDLVGLGYLPARQDDFDKFRLWEIAGAAHADTYTIAGMNDTGSLPAEQLAASLAPVAGVAGMATTTLINSGPQQHYVISAAIHHVIRWAQSGEPAPAADRIETVDSDTPFRTDEHGNVVGGLRTPWVDVPTATLTGLGQSGEGFGRLFGQTRPFESDHLARLYPTKDDYLAEFGAAAERTAATGHLLRADLPEILALASASYDLLRARPPADTLSSG